METHSAPKMTSAGPPKSISPVNTQAGSIGNHLPPHNRASQTKQESMFEHSHQPFKISRHCIPADTSHAKAAAASNSLAGSTAGDLGILPKECILSILHFFSFKDLRLTFSQVSKKIHFYAHHSGAFGYKLNVNLLSPGRNKGINKLIAIVKNLHEHEMIRALKIGNPKFGTASTRRLLQLCPLLQELDCQSSRKVDVNGFADLTLEKVPYLTHFSWNWAFDITPMHLLTLIKGRTYFESLEINNFNESNGKQVGMDAVLFALAENCPNLRVLKIKGLFNHTTDALKALCKSCLALEQLFLNRLIDIGAVQIIARNTRV